jgi:PKHD-type hydroxylase|tara:strand:+ start:2652 stop:3215 length:564 start_codon:yes stop_codon:yes gene_type:complete
MKRNIIVAKKALSSEFCENIIKLQKNEMVVKGSVGVGEVNKKIRDSEICFFNGSLKYFEIYKPILELVDRVNKEFYQFTLTEPETFQLTKYDEKNQGFYKPHIDGFYENPPNQPVRKLSMSAQLTPPEYYEGGQLEFPDDKQNFVQEDAREQGTVVFFPSYLNHGVQPVTKGIRYSLVSWFLGPSFR